MSGWLANVFGVGKKNPQNSSKPPHSPSSPSSSEEEKDSTANFGIRIHEDVSTSINSSTSNSTSNSASPPADSKPHPLARLFSVQQQVESCIRLLRILHTQVLAFRKRSVACSNLDLTMLNLLDTLLIPKALSDTVAELILDIEENLRACLTFLQSYAENNENNSYNYDALTSNGTLNLTATASDQEVIDSKLLEFQRVVHLCQHSLSLRLLQEIELHCIESEEERSKAREEKLKRREQIMQGLSMRSPPSNNNSEQNSPDNSDDEDEQYVSKSDRRATLALKETTMPSLPFPLLSYIPHSISHYIPAARSKEFSQLQGAFGKLKQEQPRYIFLSGAVGLGVSDYARFVHNKLVDASWIRCSFEFSRANQLTKNPTQNPAQPVSKSADLHHLRVDSETIMKQFLSPLQLQCFDGLHFIPSPAHIQFNYNHNITNKQVILLFDNVQPQDSEELLRLLPQEGRCIIILTSRKELRDLFKLRKNSVQQIIQPISEETALSTAKSMIKQHRKIEKHAESPQLKQLINKHAAGHLLTLHLLVKQLNSGLSPADLLGLLDAPPGKVESAIIKPDKKKNKCNIALERLLAFIFVRLSADQQLLFLQLHVFASSFDYSAVCGIISAASLALQSNLQALAAAGLLEIMNASVASNSASLLRYRMHERVRELSVRLACVQYPDTWRRALQLRFIDYYAELLSTVNSQFSELYVESLQLAQPRPTIAQQAQRSGAGLSGQFLKANRKDTAASGTSQASHGSLYNQTKSYSQFPANVSISSQNSSDSGRNDEEEINNEIEESKNNRKLRYGSLRFAVKSGVKALEEDEQQETVPNVAVANNNSNVASNSEQFTHTYTAAGRRHTLAKTKSPTINCAARSFLLETLKHLSKQDQQVHLLFIYDLESVNFHSAYRFAYTCSKRNRPAAEFFAPIALHGLRMSSSLLLQYYYRYLELSSTNSPEWLHGLTNLAEAYKSCGHYQKARTCISELLAVAINGNLADSLANIVEAYLSLAAVECAFLDTIKLKRKYAILTGAKGKKAKKSNNVAAVPTPSEFPIILPQLPTQAQQEMTAAIDKSNISRRVRGLTLRPEWFRQSQSLIHSELSDNKNSNNTNTERDGEQRKEGQKDHASELARFQSPSTTLEPQDDQNVEILGAKASMVQERIVELYECALAVVESSTFANYDTTINNLHCLVLLHLASLYTHKHAYQNANNLLLQAEKLNSTPRLTARAKSGLGDIFLRLALFDEAQKNYQQAREIMTAQIELEQSRKEGERSRLNLPASESGAEDQIYSALDATDLLWLGRSLYGLVIVNESLNLYYGAYVCRASLLSLFQRAPAVDMDWMWRISGAVIGKPGMALPSGEGKNSREADSRGHSLTLSSEPSMLLHTNIRQVLEAGVEAEDLASVKTHH
jgi:tetratricopeptide (TPR) repeat protein